MAELLPIELSKFHILKFTTTNITNSLWIFELSSNENMSYHRPNHTYIEGTYISWVVVSTKPLYHN